MNYYVDKIDDYDIVFLQEIQDKSGEAIRLLCGNVSSHHCYWSSGAGRSSSKEQYLVLVRNSLMNSYWEELDLKVEPQYDWNDPVHLPPKYNDSFERPPYSFYFIIGDLHATVTVMHTKPTETENELSKLEELIEEIIIPQDLIVLGDLNADCRYYSTPPKDFKNWTWVIPDDADTTVSPNTDCAYDRIIINENAAEHLIDWGIMEDVTPEQSDRYLVWAKFGVNE